jgi:hypothetical protein
MVPIGIDENGIVRPGRSHWMVAASWSAEG